MSAEPPKCIFKLLLISVGTSAVVLILVPIVVATIYLRFPGVFWR